MSFLQIAMAYAAFLTQNEWMNSLKVGGFLVACWPLASIQTHSWCLTWQMDRVTYWVTGFWDRRPYFDRRLSVKWRFIVSCSACSVFIFPGPNHRNMAFIDISFFQSSSAFDIDFRGCFERLPQTVVPVNENKTRSTFLRILSVQRWLTWTHR